MRLILTPWLVLVALSFFWFTQPAPALTGQEVLQKMHAKYEDQFSPYFTFDQTAVRYQSPTDSTTEVWHEAISFPGRLVIKFNAMLDGNGALYAQDSQYVFKNNRLQSRTRRVHELLVLAFDVYHQPVEQTVAQLQEAGLDLSKAFETTWRKRKVYVVGVRSLDEKASYFIIDKKDLWLLQTVRQSGQNQSVVDLKSYKNVQNNWVATDLTFRQNGQPVMHEVYFNLKFPAVLPEDFFTVSGFRTARW